MGNTLQKIRRNQSEQIRKNELQVTELPDDESFTCEICTEPMLLPNKKFKNQNRCVHPFCTDCIIKYIAAKLEENIGDIPCPSLNCNQFFDPISCRNLVGRQLFVKWSDVLCESSVLRLAKCYCPNRNCSALILDECGGGNAKRSRCPNCKRLFCFKCKLPWHAGLRCDGKDINDVAFLVLAMRKKWKRCPMCRHFVELNQGCSIVRCRRDGDFCYKCGRRAYHHVCNCKPWYKLWTCRYNLCLKMVDESFPRRLTRGTSSNEQSIQDCPSFDLCFFTQERPLGTSALVVMIHSERRSKEEERKKN